MRVRRPRVRFTIGRLMVAVMAVAFLSLVASRAGSTDKRLVIPVASVASAAYGLGAMRRPLVFLAPLLVVWVATPQVDHPSPDVINVSMAGCFLGWLIGAPVGWYCRCLARFGSPGAFPATSDPPPPD